jgi:competence protein ComEA
MMRTVRMLVAAGVLLTTLVAGQASAVATDQSLVNINTASPAELATLKGIGDAKAKAIVEYRERSGPFKSVDDLANVRGIGNKLLATLRPQITVGTGAEAAKANAAAAVPPAPKQ